MFENFKKITIKGGCFEVETELELFKKDSISVVYGRNGSGKTTIGLSISELVKEEDERNNDFTVSSNVAILPIHKDSVFIFNEDFVRDHVRFQNDGIQTIVMLGEQVELDIQIAQKIEQLRHKEEERNKLNDEKKRYENSKDPISPYYFFNQIRDALRSDGGWADIDSNLKGNKVKSKVTEDVVLRLMDLPLPSETEDVLSSQTDTNLRLFRESKDAQLIEWVKPSLHLPVNLDALETLLSTAIDVPILSEREKRLLALLSTHPQHSRVETKRMLDEDWEFCPMCLREITEHDKEEINQTLIHILNDEATKYENSLNVIMRTYDDVKIMLPSFNNKLHEEEINGVIVAETKLNRLLSIIRLAIEQRRINIYEYIEQPFTIDEKHEYLDVIKTLTDSLDTLEMCVNRFNESVNERAKLSQRIHGTNALLARKKYSVLFLGYKKALENYKKNQANIVAKEKEIEILETSIKTLKSQKENTNIALNYINQELQYVFYSKQKVTLEPGDGCYKLKVNGRTVRPRKISVGERNVLGLCYFFAKVFGGKTENAKYNSECLIVIDDPVSSFDYGNRIGVMSLLRFQFGNIIKGNANSRILVLSHDLQSIFDLLKIRNEVLGSSGNKSYMELSQNRLKDNRKNNEYKKLLDNVYAYAVNTSDDDPDEVQTLSIGNIMRRMLEAFSSFCYNDAFEKVLRKEVILNAIPEEKRAYYGNFMYRLLLNTESHMADNIYTLNTISSCFTREEKVQTAKSILLFLCYVNRPHLESYLEKEAMKQIDSWKLEERNWIK